MERQRTARPGPRYVKGHCCGDGFLLLLDPGDRIPLSEDAVRRVCDPHAGLGGDGLVRLVETAGGGCHRRPRTAWFLDCREPDGSHTLLCGPAAGFAARYLAEAGLAPAGPVGFATPVGDQRATVDDKGRATVALPRPRVLGTASVTAEDRTHAATTVSLGSLHLVSVVDTPVSYLDLTKEPRTDSAAFPRTAGVIRPAPDLVFVNVLPRGSLRVRAYRPGTGEVRTGGTVACAAAAAVQHAAGGWDTTVVENPAGALTVTLAAGAPALLTGPTAISAEGVLDTRWLAAA
ncbi:hypothetical protein [Streptomyces sp. NPDC049585]|uniref:hypothetical protein n=1 Tax=Streptomyces sp. NPDC049585 TaxID=3155154 RepID=UPI00344AD9EC